MSTSQPNLNVAPEVDLHSPRASRIAKQAFFRLLEVWQVGEQDGIRLLGDPSRGTYYTYKRGEGGPLTTDQMDRVSYLLGIYKALHVLFTSQDRADAWVRQPNTYFGGRTALAHMIEGGIAQMAEVRDYLDHVRGGLS